VSAEEMRALTSIDAIRDEANERIKEERERHAHLIKEIQRASDIKVQHVEAASKALREQISQLQNSGDLTTTILTQTRETQDATQKMVNEANERVRKTEDERSRMILEQGHLSNQIADAQATKSADKEQLQRLTVSLEKATKTIELLERQQEKSQEKIKGYIEMEKQWQADKTAYGVVVTKYDELKGDCEFAIGRIGELKADKEALQQELDAEREARDELALGFEDI
jgi:chromosome segregation ATPase